MANGPIRTFYINREAVAGTLAATLLNEYFEPPLVFKDNFARKLMPMHNGTASGTILTALGPRHSVATIKVPLLYDVLPLYLIGLFGPATSEGADTYAGTYHHIFKFGPASTPPTYSLQVFNGVSDGWRQMTGAILNTLNITGSATEPPMLTMNFLGPAATRIGTPTVANITNLWNPAGSRALEVDVNGAVADAINYNMTFDGKRTPFWTARSSANMNRAKRGLVEIKGDMLFDYPLYAGSYKQAYDQESDLGHILINYTSTADSAGSVSTNIPLATAAGATTFVVASATGIAVGSVLKITNSDGSAAELVTVTVVAGTTITANVVNAHGTGALVTGGAKPYAKFDIWGAIMSDTEEPDDGPEAAQKATFEGNYDGSNATKGTVTVLNSTATYAGA